jgi:hypothetical protein
MGCGVEGIICVMMGLLVGGSLGSLATIIALFVGRGSLDVSCVVLECCICFMNQDRRSASVDCPIMWHLCAYVSPCTALAPLWSLMRSTQILALGSCNLLLEHMRPGPGMPFSRQNAWELGRLLSFGRARRGLFVL